MIELASRAQGQPSGGGGEGMCYAPQGDRVEGEERGL